MKSPNIESLDSICNSYKVFPSPVVPLRDDLDLVPVPEIPVPEIPVPESLKLSPESSESVPINLRRINLVQLEPVPAMNLPIKINGVETTALLDTGAHVTLMRKSVADQLGIPVCASEKVDISGVGGARYRTLGLVEVSVVIHGIRMRPSHIHVVDNNCIDFPVFLGSDFFKINHLNVNSKKRTLIQVDSSTGARWVIYVDPPFHSCHLVCYNIPCVATKDVTLDSNIPEKIPVSWKLPGELDSGYDCPKCMADNITYVYDGEIVDNHLKKKIVGFTGCLGPCDSQSFILVSRVVPQVEHVKKGDIMGTISTLVEVPIEEFSSVNTVTPVQSEMVDSTTPSQCTSWSLNRIKENMKLGPDLTPEQEAAVYTMLFTRKAVLSTGDGDVGKVISGRHHIDLYDDTPIYQRPRRFPDPVADTIEEQCQELNALDIIEPSMSPWSSPVVPVRKPDGSIRLCIDYRKLNLVTIPDRFPMPNLTDAIYSLHGVTYFTTLDLVRGYYQLPVDPESREYTAFSTCRGHWQFKRMPFGLRNAPAAFQRQMQAVLMEFPHARVIVYIDDILIMETDFQKHLDLVQKVLSTLEHHGIKIKPAKCAWFQDKVKFLGHLVTRTGVSKLPEYIKKVEDFPQPTTVRQLREFLGLVNFQRKFAAGAAEIGRPLYSKTGGNGKKKLQWNDEMDQSFKKLKQIMSQEIELAFPDYSEAACPLELYVDASGHGVGACLCQNQNAQFRIIAYDSTSFNDTQKRYSVIERELAAIRWGVKTFRAFLYGQSFVLHTDHQPLVYLQNMRLVDSRLARTLEDLSDFDFKIVYTPGCKNGAADALSRLNPTGLENSEVTLLDGSLPAGLQIVTTVPGGGDSMLKSLFLSYQSFFDHQDADLPELPDTAQALRELLIDLLAKDPTKYGLVRGKPVNKLLKLLRYPGQMPIPEVLVAFSEYFKVIVCVHFGGDKPVLYRGISSISNHRIHLQCLAGIHYNPVRENPQYDVQAVYAALQIVACNYTMFVPPVILSPFREEVSLAGVIVPSCEDHDPTSVEESKLVSCNHSISEPGVVVVSVNGLNYCALLDSGAMVNLMCETVLKDHPNILLDVTDVRAVTGIASGHSPILGAVRLGVSLCGDFTDILNVSCAVVSEGTMGNCFILGQSFLSRVDLELDFYDNVVYFDNRLSPMGCSRPLNESGLVYGDLAFVYRTSLESTFISEEDISSDQLGSAQIRKLKDCIVKGISASNIPRNLKLFKRSWNSIQIHNDLVMKRLDAQLVPLVSFEYLLGIVLNTHIQMAHIGAFKLFELIGAHVWHPSLRKMVRDASTTCGVCQKNKPTSRVTLPPTLKIQTQAPFELMAIDLVSLPVTSQGYLGVVVIVDHFSKWLAVAPIKNKRSQTIINLLENNIFPSLLKLPVRMLSDNGPEFSSLEFNDLMERFNIHHIKTTVYKPSSNGAVERVNRTIIAFLRDLISHPSDWPSYLPQAVLIYNNTVHNETKISPAGFLLSREHSVKDVPLVSPETRELWSEGHPQYSAFQVGQSVLRKIHRSGRLNVHKFASKYEGPFKVFKVNDNQVTYELVNPLTGDLIKAHHVQLKVWKEPPGYIITYLNKFPIKVVSELEPIDVQDGREIDFNYDLYASGSGEPSVSTPVVPDNRFSCNSSSSSGSVCSSNLRVSDDSDQFISDLLVVDVPPDNLDDSSEVEVDRSSWQV